MKNFGIRGLFMINKIFSTLFGQICSKNSRLLRWNLTSTLIKICWIRCSCSIFWANLVRTGKIVWLRWNLAIRLIQISRFSWCSCDLLWTWNYRYWTNLIQIWSIDLALSYNTLDEVILSTNILPLLLFAFKDFWKSLSQLLGIFLFFNP